MGATHSLKYYWPTSFYCTAIQPTPFFLTSPYHGCKQGKNGAREGKRVCEVRFFGMPILQPILESPGNLTGPKSNIQIEI